MPDQQTTPPNAFSNRRNVGLFVLLGIAVAAGVVGYALSSRNHPRVPAESARKLPRDPQVLAGARQAPRLLFRNTALGEDYGMLCMVPLNSPDRPRLAMPLECDRVYA